jgi:hypothetical protein
VDDADVAAIVVDVIPLDAAGGACPGGKSAGTGDPSLMPALDSWKMSMPLLPVLKSETISATKLP